MRTDLQSKCELFIRNKEILRKVCFWDETQMILVAAYFAASEGKVLDTARLKESNRILKKHMGVFSGFRNCLHPFTLVKMSLSTDPEAYLLGVRDVNRKLNRNILTDSDQHKLAAFFIYDHCGEDELESVIARTGEIYADMKKAHPFRTRGEDISRAAMMALADRSGAQGATELEHRYEDMKNFCRRSNTTRFLNHAMAAQAVFPLTHRNREQIVEDIAAVDGFLKTRNIGNGILMLCKNIRMMYATLVVADMDNPGMKVQNTMAAASTLATVIMQYVAIFTVAICLMLTTI